jgi:hypothetical protein
MFYLSLYLFETLLKGLYWLQPPAIRFSRGDQYKIGLIGQFYIGWAHQYIRTKEKCISGPEQYEIGKGDQSYIGCLGVMYCGGL